MTKNERILVIALITLIGNSEKYISQDFVAFPNKEIGFVRKAITYFEKVITHFGKITILDSEIRTLKNRLDRQILKLDTAATLLDLPQEDFIYIALMDLMTMQFDEIIENQKLDAAVKTNLKTGNTYLKKFLGYIQDEIGA